ncbi:MAG: DUF4340 domain-containing protein [Anaerolineaceae bacterium]|nr:DUF4340 domain-containing protein [Anaerolineaceae bacterium]
MIRKNTWIMLGLLLILAVTAFILPRVKGSASRATVTITPSERLLSGEKANFIKIRLSGVFSKPVTLQKNNQGVWTVIDPQGLKYDSNQLNSAVDGLTSSAVLNQLPTQPSKEDMGLLDPTFIIEGTQNNGTLTVINVGKLSPTGSGYYVQQDSNQAILVSSSPIKNFVELFATGTPSPTPLGY